MVLDERNLDILLMRAERRLVRRNGLELFERNRWYWSEKLAGREGFLILFHLSGQEDRTWWNVGGWGNTRHAIEHSIQGTQTPVGAMAEGRIETDRWYDIKIEVNGSRIRCSLDGKLIHDETAQPVSTLFAVAGRDDATGDVVLKVINTAAQPCNTTIHFGGVNQFAPEARMTVLTADRASANNSLDNPTNVVPSMTVARISGTQLTREFPPNSLTVMRLKGK